MQPILLSHTGSRAILHHWRPSGPWDAKEILRGRDRASTELRSLLSRARTELGDDRRAGLAACEPLRGRWPDLGGRPLVAKGEGEACLLLAHGPLRELPAFMNFDDPTGWSTWEQGCFWEHWRSRFGAVPCFQMRGSWYFTEARRPATFDEALTLADEHLCYCSEHFEWGAVLSARLPGIAASTWWQFWWD